MKKYYFRNGEAEDKTFCEVCGKILGQKKFLGKHKEILKDYQVAINNGYICPSCLSFYSPKSKIEAKAMGLDI